MKYLNLAVALRDTEPMMTATMEQIGIWFLLQSYCHDHENLGTIRECKAWPDKLWQRMGLPDAACVAAKSPLWHWKGYDLVVYGYNKDKQTQHEGMVKQRRNAANSRWKKGGQNGLEPH